MRFDAVPDWNQTVARAMDQERRVTQVTEFFPETLAKSPPGDLRSQERFPALGTGRTFSNRFLEIPAQLFAARSAQVKRQGPLQ